MRRIVMLNKNGVALLMSLGMLALLSILGVAFATMMRMGERTTRDFVNEIKARYLAEAGIQFAIGQLKYNPSYGARANAVDDTSEVWYNNGYSDTRLLPNNSGYNVSIVDCASQIYINDDNPNLLQMLKNLNTVLGSPLSDDNCDDIVNDKPYLTKEEIKRAGRLKDRHITNTKYNAIKDYITVHAYVDSDVVDPRDIPTRVDPIPYVCQDRTPVNVNTATHEVLQAVLTGIKAIHSCPQCGGDGEIYQSGGSLDCEACVDGNLEITSDEASDLATYIINDEDNKRPYKSWGGFYNSIKNYSSIGSKDEDLVMANANPNTGFSWIRNLGWGQKLGYIGKYVIDYDGIDYDRDEIITDSKDKGLTVNTTEFSFNSGGFYEIESTGILNNALGNIVAQKKIKTVVNIFNIFRETTQNQFEYGSKTNTQTYPEPDIAGVNKANYDGQIMLAKKISYTPAPATIPEPAPDPAPPPTVHFRANYLTTLNADSGGGNSLLVSSIDDEPNTGSVANILNKGELMPDGMLVDNYGGGVRPIYLPVNNISEQKGTLEIWFKTMYNSLDTRIFGDSPLGNVGRKLFRLTSYEQIVDYDTSRNDGHPYLTFYIWSDNNATYAKGMRGGGRWYPATEKTPEYWIFADGRFAQSSTQYGDWDATIRKYHWYAGKWNHLVITWKNPLNEGKGDPAGTYANDLKAYFNGNLITETEPYYWHTPYTNDYGINYDMMIGSEKDEWNLSQLEFSDSIIGKVRIWDADFDSGDVLSEYNAGLYRPNGSFNSATYSTGQNVEWGAITWTEAIPDGINGDITVDVDTGRGMSGNFGNPEGNNPISGTSNSISYSASFSASATCLKDTPVLEDITITYLPRTRILYWREN